MYFGTLNMFLSSLTFRIHIGVRNVKIKKNVTSYLIT
jgi:hypothetical protein